MAKRELIEPKPGEKRYVRRDDKGHFTHEQDDVGPSLTQDRRKEAKHEVPRGQGDRGDRKPAAKSAPLAWTPCLMTTPEDRRRISLRSIRGSSF